MKHLALSVTLVSATLSSALAQRSGSVTVTRQAPNAAASAAHGAVVSQPLGGARPRILLTGYWPPSNEAVRPFSRSATQNPGGWQGADWRGLGYDIVSYFPEFANPNCSNCGRGNGDLEVDYQDTTADFAAITAQEQPIAIITFSRGFIDRSWEVEMNQFNRTAWIPDFLAPTLPTPQPPDGGFVNNFNRLSALPVEVIVARVAQSGLNINPAICFSGDGGGYLSEFIAYLSVWYQNQHRDPLDPAWCISAGHIHVGGQLDWPTARQAVERSLEALIDHLDGVRACTPPPQPYCGLTPNSAGGGTMLHVRGVPSLSGNLLGFAAQQGPPSATSILVFGSGRAQSPLGDGQLCIAANLRRIGPVGAFSNRGAQRLQVDLTQPIFGNVTAGSTWSFQLWHRDNTPAGANLSDALEVTFCQ